VSYLPIEHHGGLPEARLTFEKMLGHANHLGLYAEQIAPTGEALGNFSDSEGSAGRVPRPGSESSR
jgi:hypothetical protein